MIDEYKHHNLFWESLERFQNEDPNLSLLKEMVLVHQNHWWSSIDWQEPGILILTGGRQIGKTTSTKLLIKKTLVEKKCVPQSIFYLPCDQILDHRHLSRVLNFFFSQLDLQNPQKTFLLIIDEITFVKEWDRTIKALADEGRFRKGFCILTGSDSVILKEAAVRFPGRRGRAEKVDFHIYPLTFREYVELVQPEHLKEPQRHIASLFVHFEQYLKSGGFLRAINDLHMTKTIREATFATFEQWIRGDFIKRGKSEETLLVVLQTLYDVGISQNTYSGLTQRAGTVAKETFIDYCRLLERMDVLFTLEAFDQNKRRGFPKKAFKTHFADPFIKGLIERWLIRERRIGESKKDETALVESCVAAQYRHWTPLFYMKAEGEIDLVLLKGKEFIPIEVKWARQIRPHDIKQLKKYKKSIILSQTHERGEIEGIVSCPLPLFLIDHARLEDF